MKKSLAIVCLFYLFFTFSAQSQSPFPNTIFYQIYTRGFYDSNGDGLGDFNGITQKLDYIEDLGVGALWIMPLFKSNTPHKYFSTDHMLVDPEYGTNNDLKKLVDEANKRNIKVLIDFSINHVNNDNAWFLDAVEKGKDSPYYDYFHFVENEKDCNPEIHTKEGVFDSAFVVNYKTIVNSKGRKIKYYARFMDAPDLNYDNPKVRDYYLNVGRYWVGEIGIDGLRLDAARHIYDIESDGAAKPSDRNFKWWKTFCDEMHRINPDVFLLGEIWSSPKNAASYLATGMDATFNFDFSAAILKCVKEEKNQGLTEEYLYQTEIRKSFRNEFGDATFLINHDMKRLLNELEHDKAKTKLAVSILMTFPGSPFIYYGEELGFEADWHLLWLPMLWDRWGKDSGQTSWVLGDSTIMNSYLTVQYDRKNIEHFQPVSIQKKDKNSWYNFYRNIMRWRASTDALTYGNLIASDLKNENLISFIRETKKESVLVIHNVSNKQQVIEIPNEKYEYKR
ncbi:MAG: alpha-amylase family glycosyl hydrolase, partial [Draconibacterium sp.]|nr:alpha-amylase family glycosyl hydrolase [Draconibacterium sp.]